MLWLHFGKYLKNYSDEIHSAHVQDVRSVVKVDPRIHLAEINIINILQVEEALRELVFSVAALEPTAPDQ